MWKKKVEPYFMIYVSMNPSRIKDLNVEVNKIKVLGERK